MNLPIIDYIAFAWFLLFWIGYTVLADIVYKDKSITSITNLYRYQWMRVLTRRDNRIVDMTLQGILSRGTSFFASTSILIIGGLMALLGSIEKVQEITSNVPFIVNSNIAQTEMKIFCLLIIFIYAFFKFVWSFRLFNNCSILMGAVPLPDELSDAQSDGFARTISGLHCLAGKHFNNGLRAFMFSLAILGWFISPYLFMIASTTVALIIQRREFYSKTHDLLKSSLETCKTIP